MQQYLLIHKNRLMDVDLYELWDLLVDSGADKATFYGGQAWDHHSFRDLVRRGCNEFFAVYCRGVPGGMVWLNDRRERSALIHFALFRAFRGREGIAMGRYVLSTLLCSLGFDVLVGHTPTRYPLAIRFARRLGFKPVGVLPKGAWFADTQQSEDVLISAITREDMEE